jgi:hypothetical protein
MSLWIYRRCFVFNEAFENVFIFATQDFIISFDVFGATKKQQAAIFTVPRF